MIPFKIFLNENISSHLASCVFFSEPQKDLADILKFLMDVTTQMRPGGERGPREFLTYGGERKKTVLFFLNC